MTVPTANRLAVPGAPVAWLVFALLGIANVGNFYVYDSIAPVADLLQQQRHFSDSQLGLLNAVYNLPNIVLLLVGGLLVDRFGAALIAVITAGVCLAGAVLTAVAPDFGGMVLGRLLFGVGAETFIVATTVTIIDYFPVRQLAFAMAASLALGRLGSYGTDMSPTWFHAAYARGWQPPLIIAAILAGVALVAMLAYYLVDRRYLPARAVVRVTHGVSLRSLVGDLFHTGRAYWLLLVLCVLWYAVMFAFRSTFAIKYFQHTHGVDLATAGRANSYVFLAAIFATPLFGWICDRTGRYAPLLAVGALCLPAALAIMAFSDSSLWVGTFLIGVSYSLVPAVLWPLISRLVPTWVFGSAMALMSVVQNLGTATTNLVAGWLNDHNSASAVHPQGYVPMMLFFLVTSCLGLVFALWLWRVAGRRHQELAYRNAPSAPATVAVPA